MTKPAIKKEQTDVLFLDTFTHENLKKNAKHYLLLEGDLNENLYDEVTAIEFQTLKQWLYEDTEFDEEKEHGPLLVELDEKRKLLKQFSSLWMKQHLGIVISTFGDHKQLVQHLLKLRYAKLPEETIDSEQKVMFRWYEPRQLFGLLSAFHNKERANFMQVIDQISWCEWAFDQGHWYQVNKPEVEGENSFIEPMPISKEVIESLNKHDERYFVREITRELIDEHPSILKKGSEEELADSILNQTRIAIIQGVNRRNDIKEFIYKKLNT